MNFFKWMVIKMYGIKEKKQQKDTPVFFRKILTIERASSIGNQSILGRKDDSVRKIDGDGKNEKKETK